MLYWNVPDVVPASAMLPLKQQRSGSSRSQRHPPFPSRGTQDPGFFDYLGAGGSMSQSRLAIAHSPDIACMVVNGCTRCWTHTHCRGWWEGCWGGRGTGCHTASARLSRIKGHRMRPQGKVQTVRVFCNTIWCGQVSFKAGQALWLIDCV